VKNDTTLTGQLCSSVTT